MLAVSERWRAEMSRSGVHPVYRVIFRFGPIAYITVSDYAAATGAINISVEIALYGGGTTTFSHSYVPGTDFTASTSNAVTASNIAAAISELTVNGPNTYPAGVTILQVAAFAYDNVVVIVPNTLLGIMQTIDVTLDSTAPWHLLPREVPYETTFCTDDYVGRPAQELPLVASVRPVRNSMDPVTRVVSIGSIDIELGESSGVVRDLLVRAIPHNRIVRLQLGCATLAASDFAPVGTYVIDEIIPQPGAITVRVLEPIVLAAEAQITANMFGMHPLTAMRILLRIMGFPLQMLDESSLDPEDSRYEAISHWVVSRHNWYTSTTVGGLTGDSDVNRTFKWPNCNNGISQPTAVKQLLDELAVLMNGAFSMTEDGIYSFVRYDPSRAVDLVLGNDDVDSFEQLHTLDNQLTNVQIIGAPNQLGGPNSGTGMTLADATDYVASATYTSGTLRATKTHVINTQWIGVPAFLWEPIYPDTLSFAVAPATMAGFCGTVPSQSALFVASSFDTGFAHPQPSQTAGATLSSGIPARSSFLLLIGGFGQEVIECSGHAWNTEKYILNRLIDDGTAVLEFIDFIQPLYYVKNGETVNSNNFAHSLGTPDASWNTFYGLDNLTDGPAMFMLSTFIVHQRDWLNNGDNPRTFYAGDVNRGDSITDGGGTRVYDITIAKQTANDVLTRFRFGAPVVRVRVPIHNWALQLGDFVELHNDVYIGMHTAQADGGAIFEVTGKELCVNEDSPGVTLELTWARDGITPAPQYFSGGAQSSPVGTPLVLVVTDDSLETVTTDTDEPVVV